MEQEKKQLDMTPPDKIYMTPSYVEPDNVLLASFSKSHLDYHRDIEYIRRDALIELVWYRTREQVPEQVPEGKGYNQVLSIEEDGYAHLGTTPHPDSVKWCYIKQLNDVGGCGNKHRNDEPNCESD